MYNMDISIFGYKLNLEILILIGVIYLIMAGHTLCGCCNFSLMEGLDNMVKSTNNTVSDTSTPVPSMPTPVTMSMSESTTESTPSPAGNIAAGNAKNGSSKASGKVTESFVGANTNYGESSQYDLAFDPMVNTSSWDAPNLTVIPGKPLNSDVKKFLSRKQQQLPLPEGEMDFFANVPFKGECCPNTYSNSMGCACMTSQDYNYLITRGGNNVPYSEY